MNNIGYFIYSGGIVLGAGGSNKRKRKTSDFMEFLFELGS